MLIEEGNWAAAFRIAHWTRDAKWITDQIRKEQLLLSPAFE